VAVAVISSQLPFGFSHYMQQLAADPKTRFLVTREKMPWQVFWSYTLIPLSSIMFPHMAIMCFSARRVTAFKQTVVAYPLAILAIWLPCVFLGVLGFAALGKIPDPDGVLLRLLGQYAPAWLGGILGAGIISAVMGSDAHQVLALSTMFTRDVFAHYGGREKFGEARAVHFARGFIVVVTVIAYVVALALKEKQGIFEIAVRYAFSGFAAMAPVMVAALFWRRSTQWGALAATPQGQRYSVAGRRGKGLFPHAARRRGFLERVHDGAADGGGLGPLHDCFFAPDAPPEPGHH
jgi:Na+/proline symporter